MKWANIPHLIKSENYEVIEKKREQQEFYGSLVNSSVYVHFIFYYWLIWLLQQKHNAISSLEMIDLGFDNNSKIFTSE